MARTVPPNLDPLPEAPNSNAPSVFATVMDTFLAALLVFRTQLVALALNMYNNALDAFSSAMASNDSAVSSLNSATAAALSASQSLTAANNAGILIGALPFVPNQVYPQGGAAIGNNQQSYRRNSLGSSAADPAADPVNWTRVLATPDIARFPLSAAATLVRTHHFGFVDLTGVGGFTLTLDTALNLKSGWGCWVRNATTGDVTVQRSSTDAVDGRTSYVMYPGEVRFFQSDGVSAITSFVLTPFYKVFTSSGNFVKPPGYSLFSGLAWGAGAGGGTCVAGYRGGGGGGGRCEPFTLAASLLAVIEAVVIGAGGNPGYQTSGTAGGNTSLGPVTATGGAAGGGNNTQGDGNGGPGGWRATLSKLFDTIAGGGVATDYGGGYGGTGSSGGQSGGSSTWGGAGGGSGSDGPAMPGGTSVNGGNGGAGSVSGPAGNGVAPGGGGGGSKSGTAGAGARGELRIWGVV